MTTTRRTARLARISALAATGALALGLLPLASAQAGTLAPVVSFIGASATGLTSAVGAMDGTGTSPLTASGYQTFGLDVSADGNTALLALCHGTYHVVPTAAAPSQCTDGPKGTAYDATFGLVLVHRDSTGGVVRARVLATQWDGNAVLTTNGSATSAWFLLDGILYRYDVTETAGVWTPNATGAGNDITVADSTHFAPLATATSAAIGLAVSSDGTEAATMWRSASAYTTGKVRVATVGGSGAVKWDGTYSATAGSTQPSPSSFVFDGTNALAFTTQTYTAGGSLSAGTLKTQVVDLTAGTPAAVENTHLAGFYGLRPDPSVAGAWWAWKDVTTTSQAYSLTGPITTATTPGISPDYTRADGATSFGFAESVGSVTPPTLGDIPAGTTDATVLYAPAAHVNLLVTPTLVTVGARPAIFASNYYWADLPNKAYSTALAAEVDKGRLQWSITGAVGSFTSSIPTSGANVFPIGTTYYNGHTPAVTRNTAFRWYYPGDSLSAAGTSATKWVAVKPAFRAVTVNTLAGQKRVWGSVQQTSGRIALYLRTGTKWRYLWTVGITGAGGFNFGYRSLPHGTYLVQTLGGTVSGPGWATTNRVFAF